MTGAGAAPGTLRSGFVALAGWTNVGKSTLLNTLVGEKIAAVAPAPQTTRHRITGVRTVAGRGQAVFVDTPGFHLPRHRMNRAMVEVARRSLREVDLVVLVLDADRGLGQGDERAAALVRASGTPSLAALNKIDRIATKPLLLPMMRTVVEDWGISEAIPISALTGDGCDRLLDRLLELLPEGPPPFPDDYLTDQRERDLAAEWIREKILHRTRQEIPHAAAVTIERWRTRPDGLVEIHATVLVERESQKAIVIGAGGKLLKEVGTDARQDIERMLGARVFLALHVKSREDWRNDRQILHELGIE